MAKLGLAQRPSKTRRDHAFMRPSSAKSSDAADYWAVLFDQSKLAAHVPARTPMIRLEVRDDVIKLADTRQVRPICFLGIFLAVIFGRNDDGVLTADFERPTK